ncbi:NADH-quinone oxidoreductase subunit NuoK [Nonomuraea sp. NBC_01738]|uniref:NADH-quinone oxidoreductase subunit NuoK n=1 Tax=Nonomuraea sp. NBC_01738 TaxID=2976003 RepID=UPI002E15B40B|nr:NADH-quinone oxidoreductase subunit NuoK [Nonomuraea sp. NBC_01738]
MHIVYPAVVSALLFSIGVYGVLARRNTILVLMSVELMLNAVNINLVAFDMWFRDQLHSGQVLTLFIIVIAAAEVGLGLAIVLALFRNRQTVDIDRLRALSESSPPEEPVRAQQAAPAGDDQDGLTGQPGNGSSGRPAGGQTTGPARRGGTT